MLHVRKDRAGSTSYGYEWAADGAVVQVPDDVAADLVAIPDGGFAIVDPPEAQSDAATGAEGEPRQDGAAEVPDEQSDELAEPAPNDGEFTETPTAPVRKRAAKKTAAPAPAAE